MCVCVYGPHIHSPVTSATRMQHHSPHPTTTSTSLQDLDEALAAFLEKRPTPSTTDKGTQRLDEGYFVVTTQAMAEARHRSRQRNTYNARRARGPPEAGVTAGVSAGVTAGPTEVAGAVGTAAAGAVPRPATRAGSMAGSAMEPPAEAPAAPAAPAEPVGVVAMMPPTTTAEVEGVS